MQKYYVTEFGIGGGEGGDHEFSRGLSHSDPGRVLFKRAKGISKRKPMIFIKSCTAQY